MPAQPRSEAMMVALRLVAPGTQLREGLDRILQKRMGALIVIGDGPDVLSVCSVASSSTRSSRRNASPSSPRWTARSCSPQTARRWRGRTCTGA